MVMDTSAESRKVDKKTALALWDSAVLPQGLRRKKGEEADGEGAAPEEEGMKFTVITRRGNKQQVRPYATPTPRNLY